MAKPEGSDNDNRLNLWFNYTFVLFAFAVPWSRSIISVSSLLLFILWIAEANFRQKFHKIFSQRVMVSLILFTGYMLLTLLWTNNYSKAFLNLKDLFFLIIPVLGYTSLQKKYLPYTLMAYTAGMILDVTLSYLIFLNIIHIENVLPENPRVFMIHLDYSMILAFFIFFALLASLHKEMPLHKFKKYYLPMAVLTAIMLFIVQGRSGQVAFFVTSFFMIAIIALERKKYTLLIAAPVLIIFIFAAAFTLSPNFKNRMLNSYYSLKQSLSGNYSSSWGQRIAANKISWDLFMDNFWLGTGAGDNIDQFTEKMNNPKFADIKELMPVFQKTHQHNQYLQTATLGGIIALVLLLNIFFQLASVRHKEIWSRNLIYITIIVFLTGFIGEPFLAKQFTAALFALAVTIGTQNLHS